MASDARALLDKYGFRAKKSWGQNFLIDDNAYRHIVEATLVEPGDWAIEVGAGLGTLTSRLAEKAPLVVAVERDRDMVAVLRGELGDNPKVVIEEANALTFDYIEAAKALPRAPAVVGNLPYQIASQILFRLLPARRSVSRIVVMLQKEMVDRILAPPDAEAYGALSVMMQMYGQVELVCKVGRGSFLPAPNVDSAVLRLTPFADGATRAPSSDLDWFSVVVHAAFNQRRKTLRNALSVKVPKEAVDAGLKAADIDGQRRGETLSVAEFARLAEVLRA